MRIRRRSAELWDTTGQITMVTPRKIRVRLRWADGHIDTLPEPIDSNKFEVKQQDSTGDWHTFDDANEVDEEGYLIFAEAD